MSGAAASAAVITNDVFWKDTSGNNIYSQGGGVFKFGSTYYWYGVKYGGASTYASNPDAGKNSNTGFSAVTCYSSSDLVNWKFENNIITSSTPGVSAGWLGRLGVARCPATGQYVLCAQNNSELLFCSGSTPTANFVFKRSQVPPGVANNSTGDQTVFVDDDGQAYLICSSANGRSNWYVARFQPSDFLGIETAVQIGGGTGREGNCMFKFNGRYYFCSSDLHGWNASHCYYISATNIFGPYGAEGVMTNTDLDFCHVTQTGFFVTVAGTSATTVLFCGDRWSDFAGNGLGFNQWCPLSFSGSTPIFNSMSKWDFNASTGTWSVAPGNNYVLNPSYEADRVLQTSVAGWTTSGTSGSFTNGNTNRSHTGNFYFTHSSTGSYNTTTNQIVTGLPNGIYALKVWYQSSGGQSTCRAFARNFGGTQLNSNLNTAASSWTERTITGINVTNGQCDVGVESIAAGGQWVRVDDWELTNTGAPSTLSVSPASMSFGATSSTQSATVTSNVSWTVSSNQSWITVSPTSGSNNVTLSVTVAGNTGASRSGTVTATGGGLTNTISVTQSGATTTSSTIQAESATLGGGVFVESTNAGYNGTGYVNFPTTGGTCMFNNVNGGSGGTNQLTIRYANGSGASRAGTLVVNGASSSVTFPATTSWTSWTTLTVNIALNGGTTNTISLQSSGQDLANIDEITVMPLSTPDTYQAESATLGGGAFVETTNPGYNGTGYVNFPTTGGTCTFNNVDGNGGGAKSLSIRYANGSGASRVGALVVNGASIAVTFPATAGWSTWATLNVNVTLNNSTTNTIVLQSNGQDLANIDEITVP